MTDDSEQSLVDRADIAYRKMFSPGDDWSNESHRHTWTGGYRQAWHDMMRDGTKPQVMTDDRKDLKQQIQFCVFHGEFQARECPECRRKHREAMERADAESWRRTHSITLEAANKRIAELERENAGLKAEVERLTAELKHTTEK